MFSKSSVPTPRAWPAVVTYSGLGLLILLIIRGRRRRQRRESAA